MVCYSIIFTRWNDKFPLLLEHFSKTQEDYALVFSIEPESFLEIKLFVEASKELGNGKVFFNITEGGLILQKHLSNYRYIRSLDIKPTIWVHLRDDYVVGEGFSYWCNKYSTGLIYSGKKPIMFNEDIVVQFFTEKIAYLMFREYNIMGQDVPFNIDIQNDIIKKKLKTISSFEAYCQSLDCLTLHHIYPLELL